MEGVCKAVKSIIPMIYLMLIFSGVITHPDQIPGKVDSWNLQCLSGAIMKENGSNSELCCLLTGSVVLNRLNSKAWKGNTIEEVILAKDGGFWQYAYTTRRDFRTIEASNRVKAIAKYLLIFGPICPENVVYQGQNSGAGSGIYHSEYTPDGTEYFCYE